MMEGESHVAQDEKEKRDIFSVIGVKDLSSLKALAKGEGLGSLPKLQGIVCVFVCVRAWG